MEPANSIGSIGKYQLLASLSQGVAAKVYLALMTAPGGFSKLMAIKIVGGSRRPAMRDEARTLLDEARRTTQLVHPNIVHSYEVGTVDGHPFLALEYLDGQTLRSVRQRAAAAGGLPPYEELRILADAARGLHHAHTRTGFHGERLEIVHGAVSAESVFVTYDGQIKLLDFGLTERVHDAPSVADTQLAPSLSPEQLRGEPGDRRSDVFGLGALLWEALTGEPLARPRAEATDSEHTEHTGRALRALRPDVPDLLTRIVARATAPRREDRYPDAVAFAAALDGILATCAEQPSAKGLSQLMRALFRRDRDAMQALIERQVRRARSGSAIVGEGTGGLPRVTEWGAETILRGGSEPAPGRPRSSLAVLGTSGTSRARPRGPRVPAWSVLLLASVIGAGAASVVREGGPDARLVPAIDAIVAAPWELVRSATAGEPTPRRAGAQEAQRPRRAATVQVVLRARPSDARATLDGAPVELPFKGEFPFSAKPRVLEIVADGYRPYAHTFSFDRDTEVEVELQARPSPGLARRRASARSVPTAAPHGLKRVPPRPATSGAPAPKKQRGLDSLDPYASSS